MNTNTLIDPDTVRKHVAMVHEHAAAAIHGLPHSRPAVLQLCSMSPDDRRFYSSAYNVGDVEHMTEDALIDAEAGKNVFIEPRLVRPGRPNERGGVGDTMAVFAAVADVDNDTNKPFSANLPPSALIETSPDNEHRWFFLRRAIGVADAVDLGRMMRESCGGDHCSGNPVQPFRVAGTPNYPNRKKLQRGRVIGPTRLIWSTERVFTFEQLQAHFAANMPEPEPRPALLPKSTETRRPAYCRSRARAILVADPGDDRSAQFMQAARYAAMGGMTVEQFEAVAREHRGGCAAKYLEGRDRLREEIDRCFTKTAGG
jgi:hypothetical protein